MGASGSIVLVFNPGGNSLKAEIVACERDQRYAFEGAKRASVIVEGIGKQPRLAQFHGKEQQPGEAIEAKSYAQAAESILRWFEQHAGSDIPHPNEIDCVGLRVVHGGERFSAPALITGEVEEQIREFERLAPLHNKSAVELIAPLQRAFERVPTYAVFDTAFHRTIPEHVRLYAIPLALSKKHAIRKYGFHGISHRYMMERYAHLAGRRPEELNLVTMHLESGCSVTAIAHGESVDNTMGLTPLQGLMMGTRSGDVDPSLVELLMREEHMDVSAVMTLLNKKSGLLGVSGKSLDTRVLMRAYDSDNRVRLAMEMFSYRVRTAVGISGGARWSECCDLRGRHRGKYAAGAAAGVRWPALVRAGDGRGAEPEADQHRGPADDRAVPRAGVRHSGGRGAGDRARVRACAGCSIAAPARLSPVPSKRPSMYPIL